MNRLDYDRLEEIYTEMVSMMEEARTLIRQSGNNLAYERFKAYVHGNIVMQLDNDHEYLGKSPFTLKDIIDDLSSDVKGDEEDTEEVEDNE